MLYCLLQEQYDPLAMMLVIRINRENGLAMARRRNPALDGHLDRVNLLLWPRLKVRKEMKTCSCFVLRAELAALAATLTM